MLMLLLLLWALVEVLEAMQAFGSWIHRALSLLFPYRGTRDVVEVQAVSAWVKEEKACVEEQVWETKKALVEEQAWEMMKALVGGLALEEERVSLEQKEEVLMEFLF